MGAKRNGCGFEAESCARAGLEEQQSDRSAVQLLPRRKTGFEIIRRLTEIIDIVDC
jgi:hypothetical protein